MLKYPFRFERSRNYFFKYLCFTYFLMLFSIESSFAYKMSEIWNITFHAVSQHRFNTQNPIEMISLGRQAWGLKGNSVLFNPESLRKADELETWMTSDLPKFRRQCSKSNAESLELIRLSIATNHLDALKNCIAQGFPLSKLKAPDSNELEMLIFAIGSPESLTIVLESGFKLNNSAFDFLADITKHPQFRALGSPFLVDAKNYVEAVHSDWQSEKLGILREVFIGEFAAIFPERYLEKVIEGKLSKEGYFSIALASGNSKTTRSIIEAYPEFFDRNSEFGLADFIREEAFYIPVSIFHPTIHDNKDLISKKISLSKIYSFLENHFFSGFLTLDLDARSIQELLDTWELLFKNFYPAFPCVTEKKQVKELKVIYRNLLLLTTEFRDERLTFDLLRKIAFLVDANPEEFPSNKINPIFDTSLIDALTRDTIRPVNYLQINDILWSVSKEGKEETATLAWLSKEILARLKDIHPEERELIFRDILNNESRSDSAASETSSLAELISFESTFVPPGIKKPTPVAPTQPFEALSISFSPGVVSPPITPTPLTKPSTSPQQLGVLRELPIPNAVRPVPMSPRVPIPGVPQLTLEELNSLNKKSLETLEKILNLTGATEFNRDVREIRTLCGELKHRFNFANTASGWRVYDTQIKTGFGMIRRGAGTHISKDKHFTVPPGALKELGELFTQAGMNEEMINRLYENH